MSASLDTLPPELMQLVVCQYLVPDLYCAQKKRDARNSRRRQKEWSWRRRRATGQQLRVIKAWEDLNSLAQTCGTVYAVINPLLYALAAQWLMLRELVMPPLSICYIVDCDWGLAVIDKLIAGGLVGSLVRKESSGSLGASDGVEGQDKDADGQGEDDEDEDEVSQEFDSEDDNRSLEDYPQKDGFWESGMSEMDYDLWENDLELFKIKWQTSKLPDETCPRLYQSIHRAPSLRMKRKMFVHQSVSFLPDNRLFFERDGTLKQHWNADDMVTFESYDLSHLNKKKVLPQLGEAKHRNFVMAYWSPLHVAASTGKMEILERLLCAGFDPNERSCGFCHCHHTGITDEHRPAAWTPLQGQENYYVLDRFPHPYPRWTPLHTAMCHGQHEAARVLLRYGANPLKLDPESDINMLHVAAGLGAVGMMELPVDIDSFPKSWVDSTDSKGLTPLFWAVANGYLDTCGVWLIRNGADIDKLVNGKPLLRHAANANNFALAIKLIDLGATPEDLSQFPMMRSPTILHLACEHVQPCISEVQFSHPTFRGPPPELHLRRLRDGPPPRLCTWPYNSSSEHSRIALLKRMLQTHQGDSKGSDAKHINLLSELAYLAVQYCLPETLRFLLDAGAELDRAEAVRKCMLLRSFHLPDGSGIATLQVLLDHHIAKDPLWLSEAFEVLMDKRCRVQPGPGDESVPLNTEPIDHQVIINESARWIIAKGVDLETVKLNGMSLPLATADDDTLLPDIIYRHATSPSAADFCSIILRAGADDGGKLGQFERMAKLDRPPWDRQDSTVLSNTLGLSRLQRLLDLNFPPWDEQNPTIFAKALVQLSSLSICFPDALAREQTALRLLHKGGHLLPNVPPVLLTEILLNELEQLVFSWSPTEWSPSDKKYDNLSDKVETSHALIRALCRSGISFKPGADLGPGPKPPLFPCHGCLFPYLFHLLQPAGYTVRVHHERVAPIIRAMVENGADILSACQVPECPVNGKIPIVQAVDGAHFQILHCMLELSPGLLQSERYMKMNLRLLHRAADLPPSQKKPLQWALRVVALLIQHGADVTEADDDGYTSLHHILARLVCAPQSLKFSTHAVDGHGDLKTGLLDCHDRLPRLLRLLWDPRLADVVIDPPTDLLSEWKEQDPGGMLRSVIWWPSQPLSTAEYLRLALAGETELGTGIKISATNDNTDSAFQFSIAARKTTARGLAKHFHVDRTAEGRWQVSVLPFLG
ncbi:hypothetical protein PspLS_01633 [Pyricularia sp. CBS 133598]|nr:hypothetical protein PspLS_01633 [Pyricularia sp. CBS 133598]